MTQHAQKIRYRRKHTNRPMFVFLGLTAFGGLLVCSYMLVVSDVLWPVVALATFPGLFAALLWLLPSYTVTITDKHLEVRTLRGLLRYRWALQEIEDVNVVRQDGSVLFPNEGGIFRGGSQAVQIRLPGKTIFYIDTDEPHALADAIREGMSHEAGGVPDG